MERSSVIADNQLKASQQADELTKGRLAADIDGWALHESRDRAANRPIGDLPEEHHLSAIPLGERVSYRSEVLKTPSPKRCVNAPAHAPRRHHPNDHLVRIWPMRLQPPLGPTRILFGHAELERVVARLNAHEAQELLVVLDHMDAVIAVDRHLLRQESAAAAIIKADAATSTQALQEEAVALSQGQVHQQVEASAPDPPQDSPEDPETLGS